MPNYDRLFTCGSITQGLRDSMVGTVMALAQPTFLQWFASHRGGGTTPCIGKAHSPWDDTACGCSYSFLQLPQPVPHSFGSLRQELLMMAARAHTCSLVELRR